MKKPRVFHPFLFAVFPILFLFSHNRDLVPIDELFLPLVIIVCITSFWYFLLKLFFRNSIRVGLIVSLFFFLFFSYGHLLSLLKDIQIIIGGNIIRTDRFLYQVFGIIFVAVTAYIVRTHKKLYLTTKLFNGVAVVLVILPLLTITIDMLKTESSLSNVPGKQAEEMRLLAREDSYLPNIYYIILDGYARSDVLKEVYQYDNSDLLEYLAKKGFYIAKKSRSNYCQTTLSLCSSLNMSYLDKLFNEIGIHPKKKSGPFHQLFKENKVFRFLKQYGYTIVAFASGYSFTEIKNADIYKSPQRGLSEFQNVLLGTTPVPPILNRYFPKKKATQHGLHRDRIRYIFRRLSEATKRNSPAFVFAHINAPHPPFLFGEHGEEINSDKHFSIADGSHFVRNERSRKAYLEGYRKQIGFIDKKIKKMVESILGKENVLPIIVLQADHGPGSMLDHESVKNTNLKERMTILNAVYLPKGGRERFYEEITPVNTFRIIFNHYFDANYNLLRDKCYFSRFEKPFGFIDVTDKIE
jgi:hypothetical protein